MSGFLGGNDDKNVRGMLEDAAPQTEGIGGAVNIPGLDEILNSEGAQHVKGVMQAILTQESGGNLNVGNSVDGAQGPGQMMPATFKRFAKPGERIDNPADNLRASARFINFLHNRAGGDPAKIAAGYFSGEGNIGTDRPYKTDHKDGNGKTVSGYVADVVARMGRTPAAAQEAQAAAPSAPKWSELTKRETYRVLTPAEKELARAEYFNRFVAPGIDESERDAAKAMFMERSASLDPKEPGMLERAADGIKTAAKAVFNTDGVMGSQDVKTTAEDKLARFGAVVSDEFYGKINKKFATANEQQRLAMIAAPGATGAVARNLAKREAAASPNVQIVLAGMRRESDERKEARLESEANRQFAADSPKVAALGAGAAHALQGLFDSVPLAVDTFNTYTVDPFLKAAGMEPLGEAARLPGAAYFERLGREWTPDIGNKSVEAAWKRGVMTEWLGVQFAKQTPQMLSLIAASFVPALANTYLASMGATTAGTSYQQNKKEGFAKDKAAYDALTKGSIEILSEMLPLGVFHKVQGWVGKLPLKAQGAFVGNLTKRIAASGAALTAQSLTEAIEETAAAIGQNASERLILGKDTPLLQGALDSAVVGGMMGGTFGSVHAGRALGRQRELTGAEQVAQEIDRQVEGVNFVGHDAAVRAAMDPDNEGVDPATTRTPRENLKVWRKRPPSDAHAAGLTPEQQEVDQNARDAFADLTAPGLLDDEVAASTLLGVEAPEEAAVASLAEESQPKPSVLPGEDKQNRIDAIIAQAKANPNGGRLTPFRHPDLDDVAIRGELAYMADQAGWEQIGGKMIRADGLDQTSDVTGRTPWIPKQPWYQMMPERLNEEATIEAVGKALNGKPMTAKEKRVIHNMLDFAKASLEDQRKWQQEAYDETGATSPEQYAEASTVADAIEALDEDIPFDLGDDRLVSSANLNDEELDEIFGTQNRSRPTQTTGTGTPRSGGQGTGTSPAPESDAFQLEAETPADVVAREKQTEKTKAAERKAKADADAKEKSEEEKKEIKRRATAAADNFQLGEDPEAALSGQKDIFADAPAPKTEKEAKAKRKANGHPNIGADYINTPDFLEFRHGRIAEKLATMSDSTVRELYDALNLAGGKRLRADLIETINAEHPDDVETQLEMLKGTHLGQFIGTPYAPDATAEEANAAREALRAAPYIHISRNADYVNLQPVEVGNTGNVTFRRWENGKPDRKGMEQYMGDFLVRDGKLWHAGPSSASDYSNKQLELVTVLQEPVKGGPRAEKPKTEKEAKAKRATPKAKEKADAPHNDLDHYFSSKAMGTAIKIDDATRTLAKQQYGTPEVAAKLASGAKVNVSGTDVWVADNKDTGWAMFAQHKGGTVHQRMPGIRSAGKADAEKIAREFVVEIGAYYSALEQLRASAKAKPDFGSMFDDIASDSAKADKPKGRPNFSDMFDEIASASETPKATHEQTKKDYRNAPDRAKNGPYAFHKVNLDAESVESLLKNHRKHIPALGMLIGAKGGKNVPKMAADIMRIWKLRGELSKATADSLGKLKLPELKELAKRVGIYTGVNKPQLVDGIIKWRDAQRTETANRLQDAKHATAVMMELEAGRKVAPGVIADYPDLAVQHYERGTPEYKAGIAAIAETAQSGYVGNDHPGIAQSFRNSAETGKQKQIDTDIADHIDGKIAKRAAPRTATQAAKSAAKHTASGMANAIDGLAALFGGESADAPIKKLHSGLYVKFDMETYRKAKPLFQMAVDDAANAAKDIKDVMKAVFDLVKAKIGHDATVNMKPYIVRFIEDYYEGQGNATTTGTNPEPDRADNADAPNLDNPAVHAGSEGAGPSDSEYGDEAGDQQDAGAGTDLGVHDAGTASGGAGRSDGISEQNGKLRANRDDAEPGDATGSSGNRAPGTAAPDTGTDGDAPGAVHASDVVVRKSFTEKLKDQKAADSIPVKLGDRANIDATLPLLLEGQREDVHFAEKRLMKPDGYGVLFANGTGTGKTYLSLGIIKRMIATGKTNGLVIVPGDAVMKEWLASAPNLGIKLHVLTGKDDMGKGVSITTYANMGDNPTLLDRPHDFVVADEAHSLMANKKAEMTNALEAVRAITLHPSGARRRTEMLHHDLHQTIQALSKERDEIVSSPMRSIAQVKREAEIEEKLRPLYIKFKEHLNEQQEIVKNVKPEARPRLVAVSATPFAWEPNVQWAHGYLFNYPTVKETGGYNEPNPYQKFMIQNFGYHMKHNKLNEPDAKVDRSLMQVQFNMNLRKQGVLSTRMLDVDFDYDRKFILVDGGIGTRIDEALEWLRESNDGKYRMFFDEVNEQFDYLTKSRLLEAIKAKAAVDIIKQHHALGRKVVVFHDFNVGGGFAPFNFGGDPADIIQTILRGEGNREVSFARREFFADFQAEFPELFNDELAKLKSPIETFREAFPNALFNNGLEKKKDAEKSIALFNDDSKPEMNLIVVQSAKNAGWSGHDKSGKNMRVLINVGMAAAPVVNIQKEGRIYRAGQMSHAAMRYLNTGTLFERIAFAKSIATRSETAENLAMGDFARGLKKSFIQAFLNSDLYPPSADDGLGGKAEDRRTVDMSDFAKAKSYYYGQQKKNSRNKAAEGKDYFATPEPLGLKMVDWLQAKPGEHLLEPSGGHGAIARWFPDDTNNKYVEQSAELASRLGLVVSDPDGVINDDFENHNIINKYDGIAMNPPFGVGGKTAMEHLAKAFGHLREGGRIVAIIPAGPSMEKRLNAWLTGSVTNTRGEIKLSNPDAKFEHAIELPPSTFGRAGTNVSTRIVIIDKVKGGNDGAGVDPYELRAPDDVRNGDINDLFSYIEHMTVPSRPVVVAEEAPAFPFPREITPGVTQHGHGRVIADASKAVFKVVGRYLETDAPVAKVTTGGGKELEGVFFGTDKAAAKAIDQFTWIPKGHSQYFIRIKHVIRPQGDTPTMFRLQSDAVSTAKRAKQAAPATEQVANNIMARVLARAGGRIPGLTFKVIQSFDGLPAHILADAKAQGITGGIKGAYSRGVVYVVLDANESAYDIEETIFHEVHGHVGLEKLYGNNITTALDDLFTAIGEDKGLASMQAKLGINLKDYIDSYAEVDSKDMTDAEKRAAVMEELLAHIAEKGPSLKQTVKEIIGLIKVQLRKLGFLRMAELNDNDLAHIVAQARRSVSKHAVAKKSSGAPVVFRRTESERSVNLRPAVASKIGLLDTPMRLAFQKTGALAIWRGAFRVLEKTAGAALNNRVGEVIKAGLIDRYGLSDAVIERHEEMRVKMIAGVRTADRFLDRLKGLSRAEFAVLYAAANNSDPAAVNDMIKELPEDSQAALHEIKALVRDLGQEAVDLKMLDVDTFKANELAYLHRSYLKHEADLTEGEKANRATRIKGDQFKMRGLADIVSSDRLMKWMPDFWSTRVKDGGVTSGSVGQKFIRFERRDDFSPTDSLDGIEGVKPLGRLKEVVYWPLGEETPEKFEDWTQEGEWTLSRTHGKDVVFRRDFTQEERRRMGEIEDIRYAMTKTLNIAVHDVEVGKYFAWLAEGHAKLPQEIPAGANVIDDPRKAESRLQAFTPDSWVRVPDVKIKGTGVSAYGKLAGRYVPGPVWSDIRAVGQNGSFFSSNAGKNYEKILRLWKISKTALSPAVHVNNVMANVIMADWHDVSGPQMMEAFTAFVMQNRKPEYKRLVEDFQDNGGELGTYALTEMQRSQLAPILEELLADARAANDLNGVVNAAGVFSLLREGMVRQAAATLGQSKAGRVATAIPQKMIDLYQLEDQVFRLAAFIKARKSGLSDREAGRYARKSFLDYDIQAPWIVAAKQSGLLPFISFSYRAIPMMYETMRDKPWKMMKLALVLGGVNAASAAFLGLDDDDEEDERRWLPKEKSGNVLGMIPKMVRMPWNTASDNPVFMDIRRFIPAGDITDTGMSHGAISLPSFLSIGGPLALVAEFMTNKSQFTGKDIVLDTDTAAERTAKILDYTYKWAAPNIPVPTLGTLIPGEEPGQFQTYAWTGIVKASQRAEGTFGRDQSVPMAIGSAFGVKLEGYSPAVGRKNATAEMKASLQELRMQKAAARKQFGSGGLDAAEYKGRVEKIQEKELNIQRKHAER